MDATILSTAVLLISAAVIVVFGVLQPGLPVDPEHSLGKAFWPAEAVMMLWAFIASVLMLPYVLFELPSTSTPGAQLDGKLLPLGAMMVALIAVAQLIQWLRMRAAWKRISNQPATAY